ncbi:MAG TPA: MBOAT family O-acyltransferase, partial [Planctomycetota bacterium]|nr:MBOAT family O-acyltransferase [Planctomycetota bacterium]
GLSFYSMQKLGYVFEVFYGRREPTRSLLTFATFSAFFPQLTAGPISRARELLPQLERARRLSADAVASGAGAFLLGFVLKAYAADRLSVLVDPVFDAPAGYGAASCWLAAAAYALQVFCDFGGYSLMAIGTGRLLGIELPRNFDFPFLSRSLPEFWRRWHITLNRWLFDYIYTPLVTGTGWFRGRFRLGLVIVFLVSGAWHVKGLAYGGFLVWGLLHGLGMATQFTYDARYRQLCRADKRYVTLRRSTGYALAALLLTQLFFVVTMVPFHAHSLADAGVMARTMFGLRGGLGGGAGSNLAALHRGQVLVALLVPFVYHLLSLERVRSLRTALLRLPAPVRGVALGLLIVYLLVYVPVGASTFIYKNF